MLKLADISWIVFFALVLTAVEKADAQCSCSVSPASITICPGTSTSLTCTPTPGAPTDYAYSWVSSPPGFTSSNRVVSVSPTVMTIYTCTVTQIAAPQCASACSSTVSVNGFCGHGFGGAYGCFGPKCVGDKLDCLTRLIYNDDFGDATRIVNCFQYIDTGPTPIRVPPTGNLHIVAVSGNTTAVVGGSLPVLIGRSMNTNSGLPGLPGNGAVTFAAKPAAGFPGTDFSYTILPGDPNPLFSAGIGVFQDLCDIMPTNCNPGVSGEIQVGGGTVILTCPIIQLRALNPQFNPNGPIGSVVFSYLVTNPGCGGLSSVAVNDDQCGPASYVSGDVNGNLKVDPSETWLYQCARIVTGVSVSQVTAAATTPAGCSPASSSTIVTVIADPNDLRFGQLTIGTNPASLSVINSSSISTPSITVNPSGMLGGDGAINLSGNLTNAGTVRPGNPTGVLTLNGNYTQQPSGVLRVQVGAMEHSRLTVAGSSPTVLGGTLSVELIGNDLPEDFYPVLTSTNGISGTFGAAVLPLLSSGRAVSVCYGTCENAQAVADGSATGVVIIVGSPIGSPDFGIPKPIELENEPTGISGASIGGLPAARDLALSIKGPESPVTVLAGRVLLLLNQGDGTFAIAPPIPVGREPSGITAANLADGGADDDLAVPNKLDDNVTVLFHDAGTSFTLITVPVGDQPSAIASGNFRGNGLIDLAVCNAGDNTVTILRNNGDRTFTAMTPIGVGIQPNAIAAVPLSRGRLADLIVANAGDNTISILKNIGGGKFVPGPVIPVPPTPVAVDPGDVDNDRDVDLVVSNHSNGTLSIIRNLGDGTFAQPVSLPVNGQPGSLASWDMDLDGDIDLAAIVSDASLGAVIRILRNDSDPNQLAFTLLNPIGQGENPQLVNGTDVNGDKLDDLVAVNGLINLPIAPPVAMAGGSPIAPASVSVRPTRGSHCPADIAPPGGNDMVNVDDLLAVILAWGPCPPPCPPSCTADIAHVGAGVGLCVVNVDDLLAVISSWGPCP